MASKKILCKQNFDMSKPQKPQTKSGQIWLVLYECRLEAIRISLDNNGFYAPGQEPLWGFSNATTWIKCLYDPDIEEKMLLDNIPD
jgi:hypothetical protein